MFGDKKSLKDSERSLISETVSIDGTVNSSGAIDVAGLVKGPVYSKEIVIKETGSISGGVEAETVEIHGHLDGKVSAVVGTHTHVPTADHQILDKGTAYITDVGMSGDYNSIIGMNKDDALNRFLHPNNKKTKLEVSSGEPTLCAVEIETSLNGLSKSINPLRLGGKLEQVFLKT